MDMMEPCSEKSKWVAAGLCLFLGSLGAHHFYAGNTVMGLLQIVTFGGFGLWALADLFCILFDKFKDNQGLYLTE